MQNQRSNRESQTCVRRSSRHSAQRYTSSNDGQRNGADDAAAAAAPAEEDEEDDSQSSEESDASSSSSSSSAAAAEMGVAMDADPRDKAFPKSAYITTTADNHASSSSRNKRRSTMIGRPMHKGDDEGRQSARRVKRPPPPQSTTDQADDEGNIDVGSNSRYESMMEADEDEYDEDEDDAAEEEDGHASRNRGSAGSNRGCAKRARFATIIPQMSLRSSDRVVQRAAAAASAGGGGGGGDDEDDDDDDDNNPPPPPPQQQNRQRVRLSKCWLCTFANSKMAKQVSAFVSANAGSMDPTIMADQIKQEVFKEVCSRVMHRSLPINYDLYACEQSLRRCNETYVYENLLKNNFPFRMFAVCNEITLLCMKT